jgi:hypothetical protein
MVGGLIDTDHPYVSDRRGGVRVRYSARLQIPRGRQRQIGVQLLPVGSARPRPGPREHRDPTSFNKIRCCSRGCYVTHVRDKQCSADTRLPNAVPNTNRPKTQTRSRTSAGRPRTVSVKRGRSLRAGASAQQSRNGARERWREGRMRALGPGEVTVRFGPRTCAPCARRTFRVE